MLLVAVLRLCIGGAAGSFVALSTISSAVGSCDAMRVL